MKYKEFKRWCNERAFEGTWSLSQAKYCIDVINYIDAHYFWQKEKVWKEEYEFLTYITVIKPIEDTFKNIKVGEVR